MPDTSKVEAIIAAVIARLQGIATGDGYFTDLGASLLVNEFPSFGPDDPRQALVLLVGDDEQTWQGKGYLIRLPLTVLVLVDADLDDGWLVAERAIADVKRAVETDDRTLGGLLTTNGYLERGNVERIPRDPGSAAIGAAVPYTAPYKEGWGTP